MICIEVKAWLTFSPARIMFKSIPLSAPDNAPQTVGHAASGSAAPPCGRQVCSDCRHPSALREWVLSADSVEKLCRSVHRVSAAQNDLSDRPRIDDRDSGKGLNTPANVPKRAALEFFNRIGQKLSFGAKRKRAPD